MGYGWCSMKRKDVLWNNPLPDAVALIQPHLQVNALLVLVFLNFLIGEHSTEQTESYFKWN